jgi:hypothetical protein
LRIHFSFPLFSRGFTASCVLASAILSSASAQEAPQKPAEKPGEKVAAPAEPQNPAQFELLETKIRFEANGDSRKEVHARVHINSELGVRQFARLNFDYNRSFQSIEIPLVHITHPSGGTADILPSAITDNPNPAVINAPAYQDVRVKSVRILGLEPSDNLEYRVITTTTHHPLAPDFWLDHSFDRTGVVSQELFEIDVPASSKVQLRVAPEFPYEIVESENRTDARVAYLWHPKAPPKEPLAEQATDILLTTFPSWNALTRELALHFLPRAMSGDSLNSKTNELTRDAKSSDEKLQILYDFVSQKIRTVDLPLGALGFAVRPLNNIELSGYATQEEKAFLLTALCGQAEIAAGPVLVGAPDAASKSFPSPSLFSRVLVGVGKPVPLNGLIRVSKSRLWVPFNPTCAENVACF